MTVLVVVLVVMILAGYRILSLSATVKLRDDAIRCYLKVITYQENLECIQFH